MDCLHCGDVEHLGAGPFPRLRCPYSGATVTHDAHLEQICPRNLELVTREGQATAQTVLAVTLLLDPTGGLMTRLLSRYGEWERGRLRALMGREALVSAVHGRVEVQEITAPAQWMGRYSHRERQAAQA